jgi:hypothetical protein
MLRGIAAAGAAVMLLAAAPAPRLDPVAPGAQTALVHRYIDALETRRYADAFALLDAPARAYFRTAKNFAGIFESDRLSIVSYSLIGARGKARFRLYFAKENVRVHDPARNVDGTVSLTVPYGVAGSGALARIKDLGHPWRAFAATGSATAGGLRVTVQKISFYARSIAVLVTFANIGDGGVTVLPYGRSVLRDDTGAVYHPSADPAGTLPDRALTFGSYIAAGAQVTGTINFASPRLDDRERRFTLTAAPNLRAGSNAPFTVDISAIAEPA